MTSGRRAIPERARTTRPARRAARRPPAPAEIHGSVRGSRANELADHPIATLLDQVIELDPQRIENVKERLHKAVSEVKEKLGNPDDDFVYTDEWLGDKTTYLQYNKKWGTLVLLVLN